MIFKKVVILLSTIAIGSQVKSEVCIPEAICTQESCSVMFEGENCTFSLEDTCDCASRRQLGVSNSTVIIKCQENNVPFNISCMSAQNIILTTTPGQSTCSGERGSLLLTSTSSNSHHAMTTSLFILTLSNTMSWVSHITQNQHK